MTPTSRIRNVDWLPRPNSIELYFSDTIAENVEIITSVFCFCIFQGNKIVLANKSNRHILPGGRVERGETPDQAIRREVLEETCCIINEPCPVGYQLISCPGTNSDQIDGRPAPQFIEQFFICDVVNTLPFTPLHETTNRTILPIIDGISAEPLQFQFNNFIFMQAFNSSFSRYERQEAGRRSSPVLSPIRA